MKLFGHPESGHAYKVKLCLEVAGLEHDYETVDIFSQRKERSSEFKNNAKFHEVPLLIDDAQAYVQSNAILLHLARKYKVMGGQNKITLNRCSEWLFWEANKIGMCLPQLRVAKKFADPGIKLQTQEWLRARYEHDINVINNEFSDQRLFMLGDKPSIADFSLCGYLFFADEAEINVPVLVQQWLNRISQLGGWKHPYELMK